MQETIKETTLLHTGKETGAYDAAFAADKARISRHFHQSIPG